MDRVPYERREEWVQEMRAPLEGQTRATDAQIEQEGADFMATLAMHQQNKG